MNLLNRGLAFTVFASILLFASCKKMEFDKIAKGAWNPNLAVPLAYSNFGVYDILALKDSNDLVVINPSTGALALVYKGDVFSVGAQTLVDIQDVNQSKSFNFSDLNVAPAASFNGSVTSNNTETLNFNVGGAELHDVNIKSGVLNLNVSTNLKHDLTCVITFPNLKINGTPVSTTVSLNYTGSVPHTGTGTVNLSNAVADFTLGNTTFNKLNANISTTVNGTGQSIVGTENLNVNFGFNNVLFKNATGYFGQNNMGISGDTVLLKLFQNATSGYFELVNPKVKFIAENSFGFPIRMNFTGLKTINVSNGNQFPLTGFPTVFNIAGANSIGQSANSYFELNTTNTNNLSSVVSSTPKYFVFSANAQSNPAGNVLPLNFISDTSKLKIRTEVELPLEGSAYGFELKDTVEFNFNEDVSELESVMFRLNIDNGFPVELKSQIIFLDQNYLPVFTVFNTPESVVLPALVNASGRVNQRTKKITDIHLTAAQIALLPNVKHLLINAVSQTLNGPSGLVVKIYDDYTLNLKLGLQVQAKIQL